MLVRRSIASFLLLLPLPLAALDGCSDDATSTGPSLSGDAGGDVEPRVDAASDGPAYVFHVRATTAPFAHADGYSGQTTTSTKQGIRSLRLLRDASDPSPVLVFDHGKGFVEAGYDDGDDTVVGEAVAAKLPAGRYTIARIGVTHSRFRVQSTMHVGAGAYPGTFDCVQTLSDDVTLDGATHPRGWYRYVFEVAGSSYPQEGTDAPLPTSPTTGGFTLKTEGGESYYEVALDMLVDPGLARDVEVDMVVNMFESFRWEDEAAAGYSANVYDTTPTSHEPIRRYGANAFAVDVR